MRGGASRAVVRNLRTLYQFGVSGAFGDEQLLDRFLSRRDEASEEAFAELVHRHGPMVLGVCRRILGDAHDAEDAFQATFLVLARKAASVMRREKVASWLYGVAVRTAREARVRAARRRVREGRVCKPVHVEPPDDELPDELRDILDEELARLPAQHRGPVVLCELEGLSRPEAARRLGIPEGTLSSRLARAKARLRDRLGRRGVALPVAALSVFLVREARAAIVPLSLLESTVEAATLVAAGPIAAAAVSASVASLSEGVIKTMFVAKLKGVALAVGTMSAVVSGAVVLAQPGPPGPGPGDVAKTVKVRIGDDGIQGEVRKDGGIARRSDRDDRTDALEKKLDRVLEVLERLARPATPFATAGAADVAPPPATREERPYAERKAIEESIHKVASLADSRPAPESLDTIPVASYAPAHPPALGLPSAHQPPPAIEVPPGSAAAAPAPSTPTLAVAPAPVGAQPPAADVRPEPELAQLPNAPGPPPGPPVPGLDTVLPGQGGPGRTAPALPPGPPVPGLDTVLAPPAGPPPGPGKGSLSDRLQALEHQMNQVQRRLERLEGQLKSLDARVGGGSMEGGPPGPHFGRNPTPPRAS